MYACRTWDVQGHTWTRAYQTAYVVRINKAIMRSKNKAERRVKWAKIPQVFPKCEHTLTHSLTHTRRRRRRRRRGSACLSLSVSLGLSLCEVTLRVDRGAAAARCVRRSVGPSFVRLSELLFFTRRRALFNSSFSLSLSLSFLSFFLSFLGKSEQSLFVCESVCRLPRSSFVVVKKTKTEEEASKQAKAKPGSSSPLLRSSIHPSLHPSIPSMAMLHASPSFENSSYAAHSHTLISPKVVT